MTHPRAKLSVERRRGARAPRSLEPAAPQPQAPPPRPGAGDRAASPSDPGGSAPDRLGHRRVPSTVHRVLRRHGVPRLANLDRPTRTVVRYERERPGELVHVDVKKQGRIPDGGGWRMFGPEVRRGGRVKRGWGYDYLHIAVDDRTRIAYVEALADERRETAASFMGRALRWFAGLGVPVERVMTDNGACYRSTPFRDVLAAAGVVHK